MTPSRSSDPNLTIGATSVPSAEVIPIPPETSTGPVPVAASASASGPALPDAAKEFLLAEHARLREQILHHRKQVDGDDNIVLACSGAYWAWMLTHPEWQKHQDWVWALPLGFTLVFVLRWISHARAMMNIGDYLQRIETAFQLPNRLGWETSLRTDRSQWINISKVLFYTALLIAHVSLGHLLVR